MSLVATNRLVYGVWWQSAHPQLNLLGLGLVFELGLSWTS